MTWPPALSVVIPVYNEADWISVAVRDVEEAVCRSPFAARAEIVLIDDGSGSDTRRALDALDAALPLRVLRHEQNAGRLAARRTGLEAARGELVLFLDSRVSVGPDALSYVASYLDPEEALPTWNGHIEIELAGNPYARFWNVLTERAFWAYFGDPRLTRFELEDFDRFPKGTTLFLGPRQRIIDAIDGLRSHYDDGRDANDDTNFIRALAADDAIRIGPGFSAVYRSRDSAGGFVRHAHHRGIVFVDGFLRPGTRYFPILILFPPASLVGAWLAVRRPRSAALAGAALPAAAAAVAAAWRRPRQDVAAVATLSPVWAVAFGSGVWRGYLRAGASRARRLARVDTGFLGGGGRR